MCARSPKLVFCGVVSAALALAGTSMPTYAAETATSSATIFDPSPAVIFFPITADGHEARLVTFARSTDNRSWMAFSADAAAAVGRMTGFQQRQQAPAARTKAKAKSVLPIGCEALGSIKSPLGSLPGRCMASL